jgi:EAL domain-containing protein (putative c-di-GMP-specific phosphodiesterase class I)
MVEIGEWILQTACAQNRIWQNQGLPPMRIAVNCSTSQFQLNHDYLPNLIQRTLAQSDLAAEFLELEITEATLPKNSDRPKQILSQLRELGVYLSLDQFGTEYSSLNYLNQFPFHALKIEQSLIQKLFDTPQNTAIVQAIIAAGKCFNLEIVAQGLENQQQLEYLRSFGCSHIQGYWLSQPLTTQQATAWLSDRCTPRF